MAGTSKPKSQEDDISRIFSSLNFSMKKVGSWRSLVDVRKLLFRCLRRLVGY